MHAMPTWGRAMCGWLSQRVQIATWVDAAVSWCDIGTRALSASPRAALPCTMLSSWTVPVHLGTMSHEESKFLGCRHPAGCLTLWRSWCTAQGGDADMPECCLHTHGTLRLTLWRTMLCVGLVSTAELDALTLGVVGVW